MNTAPSVLPAWIVGLLLAFALILPTLLRAEQTPSDRAAEVFASAIATHQALHDLKIVAAVQLDERAELVMPNDQGTTSSIVRTWRHECRADYRLGALVSETYRTSEKVDGVELVDFPRPVLSHRLDGDAAPRAIRQAVPRDDPNWSTIEPNFQDDTKLVDPVAFLDTLDDVPTHQFLQRWQSDYIETPGLAISVHEPSDGSTVDIVFDYVEGMMAYRFSFEQDASGTRWTALDMELRPGCPLNVVMSASCSWQDVALPDNSTIRLPARVTMRSSDPIGLRFREVRASHWSARESTGDLRDLQDYVATRSALIMYEGMQHRLAVEQRRREERQQAAPNVP